jgi:hypothetical protein
MHLGLWDQVLFAQIMTAIEQRCWEDGGLGGLGGRLLRALLDHRRRGLAMAQLLQRAFHPSQLMLIGRECGPELEEFWRHQIRRVLGRDWKQRLCLFVVEGLVAPVRLQTCRRGMLGVFGILLLFGIEIDFDRDERDHHERQKPSENASP